MSGVGSGHLEFVRACEAKECFSRARDTLVHVRYNAAVADLLRLLLLLRASQVKRVEYQLLDVAEDGFLSLLDEGGETRDDLRLPDYPEGFGAEIQKGFSDGKSLTVTVQSACGIDQVVAYKEESA